MAQKEGVEELAKPGKGQKTIGVDVGEVEEVVCDAALESEQIRLLGGGARGHVVAGVNGVDLVATDAWDEPAEGGREGGGQALGDRSGHYRWNRTTQFILTEQEMFQGGGGNERKTKETGGSETLPRRPSSR